MAIESLIRYGDNDANELSCEHPQLADDKIAWRDPAPGSRRIRNDAGTTDAWVRKYDYKLATRLRYFSRQSYDRLGDFLDYAGEGGTFKFIPDARYPDFYVADCVLDTPFETRRPEFEQSDGSNAIDIVIRQQAFDFDWALRGVMFEYLAGKPIAKIGGAFDRSDSSTCATQVTRDGELVTVAADVLRDGHFIDDERYTLLELSRQNICLRAQEFGTTWTTTRASISANADTAPDGTLTADRLVEDSTATQTHSVVQSITITADATVAASIHLKAGTRTWALVRVESGANVFGVYVNLSTGVLGTENEIGTGTLTRTSIEELTNGWYRIGIVGALMGGLTAATFRIYIAEADGDAIFSGDGASYIRVWGAQLEDSAAFPTSYIKTEGSAVTRAADLLDFDVPDSLSTPQECTILADFIERGTALTLNARLLQISDAATNNYAFRITATTGGVYMADLRDSAGNGTSTSTHTVAPAVGDRVRLRVTISEAGVVQIHQTINSGAEVSATAGSAGGLQSQWGTSPRIFVGALAAGTAGAIALRRLGFLAGTKALVDAEAA